MLLTGCFSRSIDDKFRVAIPVKVRAVLEGPEKGAIFVAPGTDGSLAIYAEAAFSRLAERLAGVSPTRQDVRAFTRLFYAQAQQVELDVQGRMRIPPELAAWAGLQKDVVLLGVQDHLELWATERWTAYLAEKQPHYDRIAEAAFDPTTQQPAAPPGETF
jgi:MraZ protein